MSSRVRQIIQELATDEPREHLGPVKARVSASEQNLGQLQREIAEEVAASLGRAARRVEAHLAELERLDSAIAGTVARGLDEQAREHRRTFNRVRREAIARLRDLKIQREALGMRRHDELSRHYPIPARKPER